MTVHSVDSWVTNADLIADVATLGPGFFDGPVLDATYGHGSFWTVYKPDVLLGVDLNPKRSDATFGSVDFRDLPFKDRSWHTVVFDPPYKLSGTPALDDFDSRYGIEVPTRWQDRMQLILDGAAECARVADKFLLVKVQDQVVSGQMRWQTIEVGDRVKPLGWRQADRFEFGALSDEEEMVKPRHGRPQPPGRRQVHARHNASQLLAFTRRTSPTSP